ncbi:DUF3871 family protein [Lutibacter sp.]|uniref:DUF3871 family protein n=1 Tax=Lutibacter sp. TaxID=1925666 RepID=UPI001A20CD86|nr:DUF3871 family protein [Lutibacter sp.]MBI9040275.1 DUF3871 family protein [Lutibacter sp.]
MELQVVNRNREVVNQLPHSLKKIIIESDTQSPHSGLKSSNSSFIEANTIPVSLNHLRQDCTIPVFSKDNECTISHQEFIEAMFNSVGNVFLDQHIAHPEIRVSHQIKGRIPEAIRKPVKELLPYEKTIYYERMAVTIDIPRVVKTIGGNDLSLSVGGVRAYNQENLYSKKTIEKFKVFIGFKNSVCTNLCISTDGFLEEIRVGSIEELQQKMITLFSSYDAEKHLHQMQELEQQYLTEKQFAQILGKARLYNHLPKSKKQELPQFTFNDGQLNTVAKDYYEDESFCRDDNGNINLWSLYNLFTGAVKSSYIDSFLERNVNAHTFTNSVSEALKGNRDYHWFLS